MISNNANYTPQIDEMDCGVACLSMILKHFNSYYSLATLRRLAKTSKKGTSALGLVKAAEKLNLKTTAIKTDMSIFESNKVQFPFIAHVIINKNLMHYFVVLKADKNYITIADPNPHEGIKKIKKSTFSEQWTGVALFFSPTNQFKHVKEKKNNLFSLIPNLVKQKKLIFLISLTAALITLINIMGSYFFQIVIDNFIPQHSKNLLLLLTFLLAITYMVQGIYQFSRDYMLTKLGQRLSKDINLGFINHLFELPMSFFSTRKTGEITSRFADSGKIVDALGNIVVSSFLDTSILIFVGIFLYIQSKCLFLITMSFLPIYLILIVSFSKKFTTLNQEQMEKNAIVSSSIIESLHGIESIKTLNAEKKKFNQICSQYSDFLDKALLYSKYNKIQQSLKQVAFNLLNILIICVGGLLAMHSQLQIGKLVAFTVLLSYFTKSIQSIIDLQPTIQSAQVAYNRINEINVIKSEFLTNENSLQIQKISNFKDITLENVSFSYEYNGLTLNNISITFNSNEKIAIVGKSGSGKSTLAKLLVNFYTPTTGKILINNIPIENIDKHEIRRLIKYVPQKTCTFSGSILENLTLGYDNIPFEKVVNACKLAEIASDIEKLPLKYNTYLDEESSILSGGQKQRIAIARSLLSPSPVIIFDEFTSNLDPITEEKIVKNISRLKNKTIIFIAHRLSVTKYTNQIVVLEDGKIIEQGSRAQLINKKNKFYELLSGKDIQNKMSAK